jgi:methylmalonyl-CoA/ethylmalonyl-CoA epimerase
MPYDRYVSTSRREADDVARGSGSEGSTSLRRLDHIALLVRDTEEALDYFTGRLGLEVVSTEVVEPVGARLTYLDCGNALLQLVEPTRSDSPLADSLERQGEGLHHICFAVDDVLAAASALAEPGAPLPQPGSGRGRVSSFVPGPARHGMQIECTEFRPGDGPALELARLDPA